MVIIIFWRKFCVYYKPQIKGVCCAFVKDIYTNKILTNTQELTAYKFIKFKYKNVYIYI